VVVLSVAVFFDAVLVPVLLVAVLVPVLVAVLVLVPVLVVVEDAALDFVVSSAFSELKDKS